MMASLRLQFPVECYKPGPTRPGGNGHPIASRLGVHSQLGTLPAPPGSRLPHLAAWTEDFLASGKGMPDDEFLQIYKVYAARNPDRAQVPPEYLEEFKQRRAADCPEIWQIEEARACAPQSRAQAASEAPTPTLTEASEPPPLEASPPPPPPSDSSAPSGASRY